MSGENKIEDTPSKMAESGELISVRQSEPMLITNDMEEDEGLRTTVQITARMTENSDLTSLYQPRPRVPYHGYESGEANTEFMMA